jgi:hypothetical protein
MSIPGLPLVPSSALPTEVRTGSKADREAYTAALGFEQILLGQLVGELLPEEGEFGPPAPYAAHAQEAFAAGLIADGGIGLAAQLYPSLRKDAS